MRPSYSAVLKNPKKAGKPQKNPWYFQKSIDNPLNKEIEKRNYSNHGYFRLRGIKLSSAMLCDIDIMLTGDPKDSEGIL